MSRRAGLVIAGGGTGGHVLAGVAIAEAWRGGGAPDGVSREVLFVGACGGIEEKLVPQAGFPLERLKMGSLNRVSVLKKISTLIRLPWALIFSFYILWREKPQAVIGVGGYASGPVLLCASIYSWFRSMKVVILEQNAVPGMTNRLLSKVVHEIDLAFPVDESVFSGKKKIVTGNPVRSQMQALPSASRQPFTVFIFGGSQGAHGINSMILQALPFLKDLKGKLRWIHQTGEKDLARVKDGYLAQGVEARVDSFIYDMVDCYRDASLVVCRAGSSTLSELAAVGRAAVLIPFPFASDNHQELNARIFEKGGAAQVCLQGSTSGEELARRIRRWLENPAEIQAMEKKMATFAKPGAALEIVRRLGDSESHAN